MPSNPALAAPTSAQPRVAPPLAAEEITPVQHRKPRVTVENAVKAYLADARSRELESSTLSKLETIFRKQFSSGAGSRALTTSTRSISIRC
jgi:hypothetical protein